MYNASTKLFACDKSDKLFLSSVLPMLFKSFLAIAFSENTFASLPSFVPTYEDAPLPTIPPAALAAPDFTAVEISPVFIAVLKKLSIPNTAPLSAAFFAAYEIVFCIAGVRFLNAFEVCKPVSTHFPAFKAAPAPFPPPPRRANEAIPPAISPAAVAAP